MAERTVKITLIGDEKGAVSALKNTGSAAGTLEAKVEGLGGKLVGTGAKLIAVGAAAGVAGLAGGLVGAVKSAATFESAMSKVEAASQASGSEMKGLHDLALSLGSDLQLAGVDATDAAAAMEELAKGGVSVSDQMGGATKGALLLFSAGADSVAEATDTAVKAMNIFGLSGNDVAHVADLMAAGAGKSATSVGGLGQAFNQSAAVAKNAGLSIEELTGTLSFLAQRGIEGSDAGTSLKTALLALQAPTDVAAELMEDLGINVRNSQGEMLPMSEIAEVLKTKLSGLSDAQRDAALKTIFGNDAIRVGIALYEGGGQAITDWTAKVDDAGYAAKIGAQRNNNLAAAFEQLQANIQTGAIVVGEKFLPVLRKATDAASEFVTKTLQSKEVQDALQRLATEGGAALDRLIAKVKDPAFQAQMREWANTARDAAKSVLALAGEVKDTLGPPIQKAIGWFGDLDDGAKKNVVTFALVAGAAVKFRDELGTLLTVGKNVIGMFAAKEAAKKTLTKANKTLAGSAGWTATAFGAVKAGAAAAAPVIAAGTVVTVAATAAWAGIITGMVKYRDASGETVRMEQHLISTREAMAFAAQHGATMENLHTEAFLRYVNSIPGGIHGTDELTAAWNRYLNGVSLGGQSTAGLTVAVAQSGAAATVAGASLTGYNTQISQAEIATRALASGAPLLASGLNAAALAASDLAVPVKASALAVADLNSYGTTAQTMLNEFADGVIASIVEVQGLNTELGRLATTFANNETRMKGVSAESGTLNGWLQVLQGEWDRLDEAVKAQGLTTDAQKQRYAELAPLIQYLNAQQGTLHTTTVGLTEQQVKNWQAMQNLNASIAEGGAKAQGAQSALAALTWATKDTTGAANTGTTAQNTHAAAMAETQGAAVKASGAIGGVGATIKMVPKDFTVTAHVDISGALAAIDTLNRNLPHSPAEEGPFSTLPNWDALFDQMPIAANRAIGQTVATMTSYTGTMREIGHNIGQGLVIGMAGSESDVVGMANRLAHGIEAAFTGTAPGGSDVIGMATRMADGVGAALADGLEKAVDPVTAMANRLAQGIATAFAGGGVANGGVVGMSNKMAQNITDAFASGGVAGGIGYNAAGDRDRFELNGQATETAQARIDRWTSDNMRDYGMDAENARFAALARLKRDYERTGEDWRRSGFDLANIRALDTERPDASKRYGPGAGPQGAVWKNTGADRWELMGGGGAGAGYGATNIYIQAPVYGVEHFENMVASATEQLYRRGRS